MVRRDLFYETGKQEPNMSNEQQESGMQSFKCQQCDSVFQFNRNLRAHAHSKHEGVTYSCNLCEYKAKQRRDLKNHQQSQREGVRYSCVSIRQHHR